MNTFLYKYQGWISQLNYALFLCLLVSLPYTNRISRVLWIAWGISWVLEGRIFTRPQILSNHNSGRWTSDIRAALHEHRQWIFFLGVALWMLWEALSFYWAVGETHISALLGLQINLLIPFLIAIWGLNKHYSLRSCLTVFVGTCIFSVFVYLMLRYWLWNTGPANDKMYDGPIFTIDWLHMDDMLLNVKHRLYYASLLSAALPAVWALRPFIAREKGNAWALTICIPATIWLLLGIYWTGTRMVLIDVMALAALAVVLNTRGWHRAISVLAVCILILCATTLTLRFHPRFMGQPIAELLAYNEEEVYNPSFEPRIAIWNAALEQPSDYTAYGLGATCSTNYLVDRYTTHGWETFRLRRYNSHNQYLMEWMELGIAGAAFFLLVWLIAPWCEDNKRARHAACYLFAIILLDMTTESILTRLDGILYIAVALTFLQLYRQEHNS